MKSEQERFVIRRAKALACDSSLPPGVEDRLANARSRVNSYTSIQFTSNDRLTARVPSSSNPAVSYNTDLRQLADNGLSCDCGHPQVTGLPCVHLLAHAIAAGLDEVNFMCDHDTTAGWKAQYPEELEFPLPSDVDIETSRYRDFNLRPPIRTKRRRGRARTRRRRSVLENGAYGSQPRRTITCSNCYMVEHNRRSCARCPLKAFHPLEISSNHVASRRSTKFCSLSRFQCTPPFVSKLNSFQVIAKIRF